MGYPYNYEQRQHLMNCKSIHDYIQDLLACSQAVKKKDEAFYKRFFIRVKKAMENK